MAPRRRRLRIFSARPRRCEFERFGMVWGMGKPQGTKSSFLEAFPIPEAVRARLSTHSGRDPLLTVKCVAFQTVR